MSLKVGDIVYIPAQEAWHGFDCTGTISAYDDKYRMCEVVLNGMVTAMRRSKLSMNQAQEHGVVTTMHANQVYKIGHVV